MLIQGKLLSYGDDLTEAFMIRRKVFVEEQKIPEELEFDDLDSIAMHVVVYEESTNVNKKAVATGRIVYDGSNCQIGRVAVLQEYRGKKYGDFTVRMLLSKAFSADTNEVIIASQLSAIDFYKKIGFHEISGDFMEAGIIHRKMVIYANDIITLCNKKDRLH